jgi:hypothetical protein
MVASSKTQSKTYMYPANRMIRSVIHETSKNKAYYLVNMGHGSVKNQSLRFKNAVSSRISIYADNKEVSMITDVASKKLTTKSINSIELPEFKTSCIVIVEK